MAETLTVNTDPETTTIVDNLTPDEQDSLQVGEEMVSQQEQLLAGKYKNAEELEKAYGELEKKLGEKSEADSTEAKSDETPEEEETSELSEGASFIAEASEEYWKNGEELKPETLEKFQSMSSQDLVSAYMEYSKANPTQTSADPVDLSEAEVNKITNSVGGADSYGQMTEWASNNLDPSVVEAFDSLLDSGNAGAIQLAVNGLKAQYEEANGYEGRMLTGKAAQSKGDVFRSQPELVAAMEDPRYEKDPAYRQDVIEKLDRSDIQF